MMLGRSRPRPLSPGEALPAGTAASRSTSSSPSSDSDMECALRRPRTFRPGLLLALPDVPLVWLSDRRGEVGGLALVRPFRLPGLLGGGSPLVDESPETLSRSSPPPFDSIRPDSLFRSPVKPPLLDRVAMVRRRRYHTRAGVCLEEFAYWRLCSLDQRFARCPEFQQRAKTNFEKEEATKERLTPWSCRRQGDKQQQRLW